MIGAATAKYFGLTVGELRSQGRRQALVNARAIAIHLARQLTDLSLSEIGEYLGGRDHTTVLHACQKAERTVKSDAALRQAVNDIKKALAQR
jgi:chromosomal replication initiator protein